MLIDALIEGIVDMLDVLLWFFLIILSSYYFIDLNNLFPHGPKRLLLLPHSQPFSGDVSFFGFAFSFFFNITVFSAFLRFEE